MIEYSIDDLDVIFISYDEPLKEAYWADLLLKYPFAKRVDGVVGFDAAHKRAAEIAETDRFITVDGDTTVDSSFFDMTIRYDEDQYRNHVFSWASTNEVNGLVYGNGSLKCWSRDIALHMNTHEHGGTDQDSIEFCWSIPYLSMRDTHSVTHPAATPYHAFRAGFREGVKMALDGGARIPLQDVFKRIWRGNANRLLTWCSIGADHQNGLWCILGARMGLLKTGDQDWNLIHISDYNWFRDYWSEVSNDIRDDWGVLETMTTTVGIQIEKRTGVHIPLFDSDQSKFFKRVHEFVDQPTPQVLFLDR